MAASRPVVVNQVNERSQLLEERYNFPIHNLLTIDSLIGRIWKCGLDQLEHIIWLPIHHFFFFCFCFFLAHTRDLIGLGLWQLSHSFKQLRPQNLFKGFLGHLFLSHILTQVTKVLQRGSKVEQSLFSSPGFSLSWNPIDNIHPNQGQTKLLIILSTSVPGTPTDSNSISGHSDE